MSVIKADVIMKAYTRLLIGLFLLFSGRVYAQNDTILYYDFVSNCTANSTAGWSVQNVDGSCTWACNGGIYQNNYSSYGCVNAANDWLISPLLPLKRYKNEIMNFNTSTQYSGPALTVKYSTNYPGTGNPTLYTWTTLSASFPGFSGNVNLSNINSDSVYVAFHYTSSGNASGQAALWTLLNVIIKGSKNIYIKDPFAWNIDSSSASMGGQVVTEGASPVLERGIVWSTSAAPSLNSGATKISRSGTLGVFDTLLSGLPVGTRIYFRAYAFNATDTSYTQDYSFYTLAKEPTAHASSLVANTISSRSIVLTWTPSATANGYLILQRIGLAPQGIPADGRQYAKDSVIGNAVVASVVLPGTASTDTIKNLLSGTRYFFSVIPFSISGSIAATSNYFVQPAIPVANDSTWGFPYSSLSDMQGIANSESSEISSLQNASTININTDGESVWKIALRDGGSGLNDPDDLPTIVKGFRINQAAFNSISNWQSVIQSLALFDDSTGSKIGTITLNTQSILVSNINLVAADNNMKTVTLRLSLKKGGLTDNSGFHFTVSDTFVITDNVFTSSQCKRFASYSDSSRNEISVVATKMRFIQQAPAVVESMLPMSAVIVELNDTFNNVDKNYPNAVQITAKPSNLRFAPVLVQADTNGRAVFNNLSFNFAFDPDTLIVSSGALPSIKSSKFKVKYSVFSDIIPTPSFSYSSNINYLLYQDSTGLNSSNSVAVFGFSARDGGAALNDADSVPTVLQSLRFNISNFQNINSLAIFDSTGAKLAEARVSGSSILLNGFSVVVPDNGIHRFTLRATFNKLVTDQSRIQFKITEALAGSDTSCSGFQLIDAGGATSPATADINKVDVVATSLRFSEQPSHTEVWAPIFPAVEVEALDSNGNKDFVPRLLNMSSSKSTFSSSAITQVTLKPANGKAIFEQLIFNDTATDVRLQVSSGVLSASSDSFNVRSSTWFRSAKTGDWDSLSTWEYSIDTGLTWSPAMLEVPYALKHGRIVIRSGHVVTMSGATPSSRIIDETLIEQGATLIAPVQQGQYATVNDGRDDDLKIWGTLRYNNVNNIQGRLNLASGARVVVMSAAVVELLSNGYASDWAGHPGFDFQNGAIYLHNTAFSQSIGTGVYFPNAGSGIAPIFRIGVNYNYPPISANPMESLVINGILEINAGRTVYFTNAGDKILRNGIRAAGHLNLSGKGKTRISGQALLGGSGQIVLSDSAQLEISSGAYCQLLNNKTIQASGQGIFNIQGIFNTADQFIQGTAPLMFSGNGTLITSHLNGVGGALAGSGSRQFTMGSGIVMNSVLGQQQMNLPGTLKISRLVVQNPYGVQLNDTLSILDTIDLQSGRLMVGNNALLKLMAPAKILHASSDRFISGRVWAEIPAAATRFYPLGKQNIFNPLTLENRTAQTSFYTIEYIGQAPGSYNTNARAGFLKRVDQTHAWLVKASDTLSRARISVNQILNLHAGESIEDIRFLQWENNQWISRGPSERNALSALLSSDECLPMSVFAMGVDSTCINPQPPISVADTVCYGAVAQLEASSPYTIKWYLQETGGSPIHTGAIFNTTYLLADTSFYVAAASLSCNSPRVKVPVKVVEQLEKPVPLNTNFAVCQNQAIHLEVPGNAAELKWYSSATLNQLLATGNVFNSSPLIQDTTFYVVRERFSCLSAVNPIPVRVRELPAVPYAKDVEVCKGNAVLMQAASNTQLNWYRQFNDSQSFSSVPAFIVPELQKDTVFYLSSSDAYCSSPRLAVRAVAKAVPVVPTLSSPGTYCKGDFVQLQAQSSDTSRWFLSALAKQPVAVGSQFNVGQLLNNTIVFTDAYNGYCASNKLAFPLYVVERPLGFNIAAIPGRRMDSLKVQVEGPQADEYFWNFGADAIPTVANGRGPHYVKWTSIGNKSIQLQVKNKLGLFACIEQYDTTVLVQSALGNQQLDMGAKLLLYPNPASSNLNIHLDIDKTSDIKLQLQDMLGRIAWSDQITNSSSYSAEISVAGLPAGIYTLQVLADGQQFSRKIIVKGQ